MVQSRELMDDISKLVAGDGPSAAEEIFDETAYVSAFPDVAEAVRQGLFASPLEHWQLHGRNEIEEGLRATFILGEHKEPRVTENLIEQCADFDEFGYLYLNPDVRQFGDALQHWMNYGRAERRVAPGTRPYVGRSRDLARLVDKPFGVNFFGPLTAVSGLGTAARGYLDAIREVGLPTSASSLDLSLYARTTEVRGHLPGQYDRYRINIIQQNCDMIAPMCRVYGSQVLSDKYNIGIWAWELAAFRPDWITEFGALDEVWALSNFCRDAIATISPIPVEVMPCVVELDEPNSTYDRAYFGLPEDVFIFSFVFDVSSSLDRKNPLTLIKAFKREFGNDPKVYLVLKYHSSSANRAKVAEFYYHAQAQNIRLISDMISDEEMLALKQVCDCFVSPHRSEGFGLNIAEMMYLGKPTIATAYSGNMEFMTEQNSYLVDYTLSELGEAFGPYPKGYIWAEPSIDHLASLMRRVYENPAEARRKGAIAAQDIRDNYSRQAVGRKIANRLKELGLKDELPPYVRNWGRSANAVWHMPVSQIKDKPWEQRVLNLLHKPIISIIVPVYNVNGTYLQKCISSVLSQYYPLWELCLCDDGSTSPDTLAILDKYHGKDSRIKIRYLNRNCGISRASNAAVEVSSGEFLALLDNDDELHPMALLRVVETINMNSDVDYIYTDEDKLNENEEHVDDYCKPNWSPEHIESVMYILHLQVIRKSLFLQIGGFREEFTGAQDYDLALRATRETSQIIHIPEILYHWRMIPGSAATIVDAKPEALSNAFRALVDHVQVRYGGNAAVENGKLPGFFRVRHKIVGSPPVTLLILTNNSSANITGRGQISLVDNLIASIQDRTSYRNYRILVIDNANLSPKQRGRYKIEGIKVASYHGPSSPFNFSRKVNFSFRNVTTELVVMLNDDMEVITSDWLEALLEYAKSPNIGVVGAKLLYPDDCIQHVGVAIGVNGSSAHLYHGFPGDFVGYNGYTHTVRNYAALTGACMATRKSVVEELGGYDEQFAIDFNDIDFCLRGVEAGYRNVFTPFCELYHFEGKTTRRSSPSLTETELFKKRWAHFIERDPSFNPNFARDRIDFTLKAPLSELVEQQDCYRGQQ